MRRCYSNDIPDSIPDRLMASGRAPSYKAMALAILKNDCSCKSLGFSPPVNDSYRTAKEINGDQLLFLPALPRVNTVLTPARITIVRKFQ